MRDFKFEMTRLITLFALLLPLSAHAAATDKLKSFVANTHSAEASFSQELLDKNGKRIQFTSGKMQFERPGKFRWEYQQPYEQLIVGDGKKFWLYDIDLQQVTVKKLDAALGSSPAALLSGSHEMEHDFELQNLSKHDELDWLQATPKAKETSFSKILMGFNDKAELVVMELYDTFSHRTVLKFSDFKNNPKLSPQQFKFTPPAGVDVLGDE